jgi:hypothetical protein
VTAEPHGLPGDDEVVITQLRIFAGLVVSTNLPVDLRQGLRFGVLPGFPDTLGNQPVYLRQIGKCRRERLARATEDLGPFLQ